jgi:hypothetical protein
MSAGLPTTAEGSEGAFLVGEESAWVDGQVLRVNGGLI